MHAIKGGWVGQTFALAKSNNSEGRKSRIRLPKEERKAMVESFIKKYQNSHNGNFPSLNLTQKEVGGSFYIVREIVREIIQENRVLAPAKLTPDEQNSDRFLEQYPLGSICVEPQTHLVPSNGTLNPDQVTSKEHVFNSSGQCLGTEHQSLDNEKFITGSTRAAERIDEPNGPILIESQARESLGGVTDEKKELEASKAKISHITADVVVETFPLRPVSNTFCGLDGKLDEPTDLTGTLEEKEAEKMELKAGNNSVPDRINFLENSSVLVDEKVEANVPGPSLERISSLVGGKEVGTLEDPSLESSNCSTTKESTALDSNDGTSDLEVKHSSPAGKMPLNAPNGIHAENLNNTTISSSSRQSIPEESFANKTKPAGSPQKAGNPTLDRINLESWEVTSKKSADQENNPLLALLKAFVTAFMKFWSE